MCISWDIIYCSYHHWWELYMFWCQIFHSSQTPWATTSASKTGLQFAQLATQPKAWGYRYLVGYVIHGVGAYLSSCYNLVLTSWVFVQTSGISMLCHLPRFRSNVFCVKVCTELQILFQSLANTLSFCCSDIFDWVYDII